MSEQAVSPEDRMMAFVEEIQDEVDDRPSRYEDEPVEEAQEASEEVAEEVEEQEEETQEEQEARILTLKHNGEEVQKTEEEVITLAQQGFDYTQKTQALAEERKQVEAYSQALKAQEDQFQQQVQIQSVLMQEIASVTAIDNQIAQFQGVNWQQLSDSDPVEAQKLFFTYSSLQQQRTQLAQQVAVKQNEISQMQQQRKEQMLREGAEVLARDIPGWGKEKAAEVLNAGKQYGFNDQELSSVMDPRMVKVLNDAAQWRKLQASKPNVTNKVNQAKPIMKSGSKDSKNAAQASSKNDRIALRKTGKTEYAAKLIERML